MESQNTSLPIVSRKSKQAICETDVWRQISAVLARDSPDHRFFKLQL